MLCFVGLLRVGEALCLRPESFLVSEAAAVVLLPRTKRGMAERVVLENPGVLRFIRSYLKRFPKDPGCLVSGASYARVRSHLIRACTFFGYRDVLFRSHSLRRGGATALFVRGLNLHQIMIYGRWASESSCRLYIHQGEAAFINILATHKECESLLWSLARLTPVVLSLSV